MCDFSEYGGKSKEWLAVEAGLEPMPVIESLYERQEVVNRVREKVSAKDMQTLTSSIRMKDHKITARDGSFLEARSYRPVAIDDGAVLPIYIHLHGGGFLFGTLSSEDAIATRIALGSGATVLNVNYRHTPDDPYPAAWNDAEDAFHWVHDHIGELKGDPSQVVVGGISAGAQLAASLALRQNVAEDGLSRPKLAGQVLMIPCLAQSDCYETLLEQLTDPSVSSYVENKDAPILPRKVMDFFTGLLKLPAADAENIRLNTANASGAQVKGLPPTVFGIAGLDPLRDEGLLYAKKLTEAGVPTDIHVFKGLPHGFRRHGNQIPESKRWDRVMEEGIKWAISKPEASGKFIVKT